MNLLNITEDVQKLLQHSEKCRESDTRLVVSIWVKAIGEKEIEKMTATDILNLISDNKLPNFESIRRVRQKLQEKNVLLRGKNYYNRKEEEVKVKEQLKTI